VLRVRSGEQVVQDPDDSHLLLEQVQGAARTLCRKKQRLALILARQSEVFRHGSPGC